jgi:hypothetical protein
MNSQCVDRRLESASELTSAVALWEAKRNTRRARLVASRERPDTLDLYR